MVAVRRAMGQKRPPLKRRSRSAQDRPPPQEPPQLEAILGAMAARDSAPQPDSARTEDATLLPAPDGAAAAGASDVEDGPGRAEKAAPGPGVVVGVATGTEGPRAVGPPRRNSEVGRPAAWAERDKHAQKQTLASQEWIHAFATEARQATLPELPPVDGMRRQPSGTRKAGAQSDRTGQRRGFVAYGTTERDRAIYSILESARSEAQKAREEREYEAFRDAAHHGAAVAAQPAAPTEDVHRGYFVTKQGVRIPGNGLSASLYIRERQATAQNRQQVEEAREREARRFVLDPPYRQPARPQPETRQGGAQDTQEPRPPQHGRPVSMGHRTARPLSWGPGGQPVKGSDMMPGNYRVMSDSGRGGPGSPNDYGAAKAALLSYKQSLNDQQLSQAALAEQLNKSAGGFRPQGDVRSSGEDANLSFDRSRSPTELERSGYSAKSGGSMNRSINNIMMDGDGRRLSLGAFAQQLSANSQNAQQSLEELRQGRELLEIERRRHGHRVRGQPGKPRIVLRYRDELPKEPEKLKPFDPEEYIPVEDVDMMPDGMPALPDLDLLDWDKPLDKTDDGLGDLVAKVGPGGRLYWPRGMNQATALQLREARHVRKAERQRRMQQAAATRSTLDPAHLLGKGENRRISLGGREAAYNAMNKSMSGRVPVKVSPQGQRGMEVPRSQLMVSPRMTQSNPQVAGSAAAGPPSARALLAWGDEKQGSPPRQGGRAISVTVSAEDGTTTQAPQPPTGQPGDRERRIAARNASTYGEYRFRNRRVVNYNDQKEVKPLSPWTPTDRPARFPRTQGEPGQALPAAESVLKRGLSVRPDLLLKAREAALR